MAMERAELPEGWDSAPLKDLLVLHNAGVWGTKVEPQHGYPILRSTNMRGGQFSFDDVAYCDVPSERAAKYVVKEGDILVTKSSGSSHLVGLPVLFSHPKDGREYLFSNFTHRIRLMQHRLLPKFGLWYLLSPAGRRTVETMQRTTTGLRNLNIKEYLAQEIPLPPLPEQHRIVARIEEFARRVEEARGLRWDAVEKVESLLPTARWQIFNELAKNGCDWQPLSTVTAFLGRGRSTQQGGSDMRLLKTRHVYPDELRPFDDCRLSDKEAAKCSPERILQPGDVLVCSSAAGCLGRPGFFPGHPFPCTTDTHVAIIRADDTRLDSRYLFHYFRSPQGQVELLSREQGGKWQEEKVGFRLTELNLADLRTVPVPLPPQNEQLRIVTHLDGLQVKAKAIRAAQAETQKELDALMPSVLARAFAGEL